MRFELRIPPLLLFVVLALAMWLGRGEERGSGVLLVLATALLLAGAVLGGGALLHFRRERTSVHPIRLQQSRVLVTRGVYRISRNPMYLGLLCWLLALACYLGGPWVWLGPLLLLGWLTRFQILPEERALRARFGIPYVQYCRRVRRWC
ncbi:isoprenylcysteine carboxylmethyltransferase family protein [Aeromonas media]|uniref:methyltransferase family protein n=1 Tax=Aeromonas media TaxID=651 RepID=UPI00196A4036|nr:isoprenylcysteine carboxylmethyltransferase family protein [Aeromonas media]QSE73283.1 isoprenylcysteine carboxylmethyltransferase family protein [Aeromonas media]